jgi:hypothetical protein
VGAPSPVVKAFLVCDAVIHEAGTDKKSCIGIFHRIHARAFPARHGLLAIYANLTDAQGEYTFRLTLSRLRDGREIGGGATPPIRIPDPLHTAELAFRLQDLVFPEPGKYEFILHANGEPIARKEIAVLAPAPEPKL